MKTSALCSVSIAVDRRPPNLVTAASAQPAAFAHGGVAHRRSARVLSLGQVCSCSWSTARRSSFRSRETRSHGAPKWPRGAVAKAAAGPPGIEVRAAKRKDLKQVATLLADVFQKQYCTGPMGWFFLNNVRDEIFMELEDRWNAYEEAFFEAQAESGEPAEEQVAGVSSRGHAVLLALSDGELVGCVEANDVKYPFQTMLDHITTSEVPCKPEDMGDPKAVAKAGGPQVQCPRPWVFMANLAVRPDCQRRGIGRLLVQAVEQTVVDQWGFQEVVLKTEEDNLNALRLYESMGYDRVWSNKSTVLQGDATFGKMVTVEEVYLSQVFR